MVCWLGKPLRHIPALSLKQSVLPRIINDWMRMMQHAGCDGTAAVTHPDSRHCDDQGQRQHDGRQD